MTDVVQCPCTLSVHFPPTVYRSAGSAQVLPDLVKSLDIANVQCIQFVPNGIVRVTFKESAQCDAALAGGVSFRGSNLRVTPVDARTRLVYLRDLPAEVPDEPVKVFLRKFGVLHSLSPQFHPGLPDVKNGTRVAKVTLVKDLPSSVHIAGFDARLWYQGQPQSCPVCRQFGHRVRDCPLNGLCRRCRQPGHMARECSSRRPSLVPDVSLPVDPTVSEDEADPDYVLSSASESAPCSGDEEVLRSAPTSVLAGARKRSAPPPVPSDSAESSATFGTMSCPLRPSLPPPFLILILSPMLLILFLPLFPVRLSLPLPWLFLTVRLCLPLPSNQSLLFLLLLILLVPNLGRRSLGPLVLPSPPPLSLLLLQSLLCPPTGRLLVVLVMVILLKIALVILFTSTMAVSRAPSRLSPQPLSTIVSSNTSTTMSPVPTCVTTSKRLPVLPVPLTCELVPRWSSPSLPSDPSLFIVLDCLLFAR